MYYIYMVQCTDGSYYTGITPDVCRRMQCHHAKKGAKYTRSHPIVSLCALWRTEEKTAAARLEYAIKKRMSREKKAALVARPALLPSFLPHLDAGAYAYVPGVTLEMCLQGEFHD